MSIPTFTVTPSSLRPLTFSQDMDQLLSELNPWVQALNEKGNAFALGLSATSATNLTLGTGIKTLSVQSGKGFVVGMDIVIASTATPTDRMLCTVTNYDVTTGALVADAYSSTGAGSASAWAISMTAAVDAAAFVTPDGTQVLTNKTLASPAMTGTPTVPTAAPGTNTTQAASTAYVAAALGTKANLASPAFTGAPTVPTAAPGTNTTQAASTAFVGAAVAALVNSSPGALDTLNELAAALGNDANFAATMTSALAAKAPLASPAMTGIPTVPTATVETDTTQAASTAFVQRLAAGRRRFTAQGAIAAGKTVVLNGNGTVSPVGYAINPGALGPEETPAISGTLVQLLDIPGTSKMVMLTTTHLYVGTVAGGTGTTTWGAGTALPTGSHQRICWHPVEGVVCLAYFNAAALFLALGTLSGNTISLGSAQSIAVAVAPGNTARYALCHNAHQNKIIISYTSASMTISCVAVHVAAGVMTAGTPAAVASSGATNNVFFALAELPGTAHVVCATVQSSTRQVRVLTVNATAFNFGVASNIPGQAGNPARTAWLQYLPLDNKFLLFQSSGTGDDRSLLTVAPGASPTVAATSAVAMWTGYTVSQDSQPFAYDIDKGALVVFGREAATNYAVTASATVSGSSLVFGPITYINTSTSSVLTAGYSSTEDKVVFAYIDAGNANLQTTRVWDTGDSVTDANNWIGISAAAIANGAQGLVITKGGVATLSGLTTGYQYYIDDLGELQQTGSRRAGVALSTTELFLTGDM